VVEADEKIVSFCENCRERVPMLAVDKAAVIRGVSPRTIYRWIEANEIHFEETGCGLIFICVSSLDRKMGLK
jgi:excisionase family DNA binding protein